MCCQNANIRGDQPRHCSLRRFSSAGARVVSGDGMRATSEVCRNAPKHREAYPNSPDTLDFTKVRHPQHPIQLKTRPTYNQQYHLTPNTPSCIFLERKTQNVQDPAGANNQTDTQKGTQTLQLRKAFCDTATDRGNYTNPPRPRSSRTRTYSSQQAKPGSVLFCLRSLSFFGARRYRKE